MERQFRGRLGTETPLPSQARSPLIFGHLAKDSNRAPYRGLGSLNLRVTWDRPRRVLACGEAGEGLRVCNSQINPESARVDSRHLALPLFLPSEIAATLRSSPKGGMHHLQCPVHLQRPQSDRRCHRSPVRSWCHSPCRCFSG